MKSCIVNYANGGWYIKGQERLKKSLEDFNYKGDILLFTDPKEINCKTHQENPYSFKPYAIKKAKDMGYTNVTWVDASFYAVKEINFIDEHLEKFGYGFQESGWNVSQWTNDKCLELFKEEREPLFEAKMISSGFMSFNFNFEICNTALNMFLESADNGSFIGKWNNKDQTESLDSRVLGHRHDQSAISIIINKLKLKISDNDTFFCYNYSHIVNFPDVCFYIAGC